MTSQTQFFPLTGGLDQETPALTMPPGKCIACLNHESVSSGYGRTQGYERFDGQPAPSDATLFTLDFEAGQVEMAEELVLTGYTSGATALVLASPRVDSGSFETGDAVGTVPIMLLSGSFAPEEFLRANDETYAQVLAPEIQSDWLLGPLEEEWDAAAISTVRELITDVPGQGPVRGVLWFEGRVHAWRDQATAGGLFHSSATGWEAADLGHLLYFTSGGPYEVRVGKTLVGAGSGATGVVRTIALDSTGNWADGTASGVMVLDDVVGTFGDETFNISHHINVGTITASPVPASFPLGGRYEFDIFNFYGSTGFERAYGANGVGEAFEFDGTTIIPIDTGMPDDRPFLVQAHKNHLFLGFPKGSLQHSELGEPRSFNARFGAAELGMGHELTSIIPNASTTLLVTSTETVSSLTGNDSSDWLLEGLSDEAGAKRFTAQRIGRVIYLDNRGLRSVEATSAYGNFRIGTFTAMISAELDLKRRAGVEPVASCVIKSKDQYLLFFNDGTGISVYFGRKNPEAMLFEYPFVVSCLHIAEVDGVERVFAGGTDGYVYELNKGVSFDGGLIEGFIALPFGHQGNPRTLKRYHKAAFEILPGPRADISFMAQFDYGNDYQPYPDGRVTTIMGGGGVWGMATWGEFIWGAAAVARSEIFLQGVGSNMGLIIKSSSSRMQSYVLQGVTLMFSPRGMMR